MKQIGLTIPRFTQPLWLTLLFLACFSLPIAILQQAGSTITAAPVSQLETRAGLFSTVLRVPQDVHTIEIGSDKLLGPSADAGFLVALWFEPRRDAKPQEKLPLVTRLDQSPGTKTGYQVVVEGDGLSARPRVYWQGSSGQGEWYLFREFRLEQHLWYVLVLTFTDGRHLGLHVGRYAVDGIEPQIELLGGYEVPDGDISELEAPLLVGSYRGSFYRSEIGALGVAHFDHGDDLGALVRGIARDPSSFLRNFSSGDAFYLDGTGKGQGVSLNVKLTKEKKGVGS